MGINALILLKFGALKNDYILIKYDAVKKFLIQFL